uniref:TspO protein n=1 Tax=OCS116 cluster bacterium TaxID=2030921 RepID=A0A2A4Z3B7_9PROT
MKTASNLKSLAPFIAIPVIVGQIPSGLAMALNPNIITDIGLDILPVPAWFFISLWVVIYAGMGITAWKILSLDNKSIKCIPVGILISGFLTTHFFWFTESFRTTAILDALGIIISFTAYWVCAQYSRKASYWLLPWAIWMPITFALKIAALNGLFG